MKKGLLFLLVILAMVVTACVPPTAPAAPAPAPEAAEPAAEPTTEPEPAADESQLVYGRNADSASLDPGEYASGEDVRVSHSIFDKLVEIVVDQDGNSTLGPSLAESWDTSDDGKEWTFKLRSGVKFHDGTDLDGDAVAFAFNRQRDPEHPHFPKKQKFYKGVFGDIIANVEAVDATTVVFTLTDPFGPFLTALAGGLGAIPSPTAIAGSAWTPSTPRRAGRARRRGRRTRPRHRCRRASSWSCPRRGGRAPGAAARSCRTSSR